MFEDESFDILFFNAQEKIQKEYHEKIKEITTNDEEERNNIKLNIISELYYKRGVKDGGNFILSIIKNK